MIKKILKYSYVFYPLLCILIVTILEHCALFSFKIEFDENIIGLGSTMLGFLLTVLSIVIVLPSSRFVELMKKGNLLTLVYNTIFYGIAFLLISISIKLFVKNEMFLNVSRYALLAGLINTALSAWHLYHIGMGLSKHK